MTAFITLYESLFEVKIANTPQDIEALERIRYQVYVNERHWEPENHRQRERDKYDNQAVHVLMTFKPEGVPLGTARIILPNERNLHHSYPVQGVCHHPIFLDRYWVKQHPEFSRFAIAKNAREYCLSHPIITEKINALKLDERSTRFQLAMGMSFGLISKITSVLRARQLEGTCAVLEKSLVRLLTKGGLNITELGQPVEHHGLRQPCYLDVQKLSRLVTRPDSLLAQLIYHDCSVSLPNTQEVVYQ